MNRDEIYFFGLFTIINVLFVVMLYGLYRWFIHKNRIESIRIRKELLHSEDSSSKKKKEKK
jgi:uncharacterized membrane protein YqhA